VDSAATILLDSRSAASAHFGFVERTGIIALFSARSVGYRAPSGRRVLSFARACAHARRLGPAKRR
jgi:hypothetical protein